MTGFMSRSGDFPSLVPVCPWIYLGFISGVTKTAPNGRVGRIGSNPRSRLQIREAVAECEETTAGCLWNRALLGATASRVTSEEGQKLYFDPTQPIRILI